MSIDAYFLSHFDTMPLRKAKKSSRMCTKTSALDPALRRANSSLRGKTANEAEGRIAGVEKDQAHLRIQALEKEM